MNTQQINRPAWALKDETESGTTPCDTVKIRLTLDVTYSLNGEPAAAMAQNLHKMCERAIGEGMLTGDTDAEVDEYSMETQLLGVPASDNTITAGVR